MATVLAQLFVNGLLKGGVYGLLAIGLTIVYGVARILNFAHGEFVMLAMYGTFFLHSLWGISPFVGLLIIVPLFFAVGAVTYRLMFKQMVDKGAFVQIFTTTGLSMILQNVALILWRGEPRIVAMPVLNHVIKIGSLRASIVEVIGFALATVLMLVLFAFLKYSHKGKSIRAVVDQRTGAMLVGLDVNAMYQLAVSIGFACVGAAGAILVTIYYVQPAGGETWNFLAFIAVVLGGYNSLPGAVIAALLIGLIESFSGFFLTVHLKEAAYFAVFLLVLLFCPNGLFGRGSASIGR